MWCAFGECRWRLLIALSQSSTNESLFERDLISLAEIRVTRSKRATIASILLSSERCRTVWTFSLLHLVERSVHSIFATIVSILIVVEELTRYCWKIFVSKLATIASIPFDRGKQCHVLTGCRIRSRSR